MKTKTLILSEEHIKHVLNTSKEETGDENFTTGVRIIIQKDINNGSK